MSAAKPEVVGFGQLKANQLTPKMGSAVLMADGSGQERKLLRYLDKMLTVVAVFSVVPENTVEVIELEKGALIYHCREVLFKAFAKLCWRR